MSIKIEVPVAEIVFHRDHLSAVIEKAAEGVVKAAQSLIAGSTSPSAPNTPPASRTGKLASSFHIRPRKDGMGVVISDDAADAKGRPYAKFLETGAVGGGKAGKRNRRRKGQIVPTTKRIMAPRPYLSRAMDDSKDQITATITKQVTDNIEFKVKR